MILTIAIPTYNRPRSICRTIKLLLPQLTDRVVVKVLDNCSREDVKILLRDELGEALFEKVEVIRHRVNVGSDVNFQRCFELCGSEYIWMLGDDDVIEDNAVEIILNEIELYKNQDLIGFNFRSNCLTFERPNPIFIKSLKDLGEKLDHFGNWLFISACVYKTKEYVKYLNFSAYGAYAFASQLVAPIFAIANNKTLVLSEKFIVTNVEAEDVNQQWSDVPLTLAVLSLLELPVGFKKQEYLAFGRKMNIQFVSFTDLLCTVIKTLEYDLGKIDDYHFYIIQQIYYRTHTFRAKKFITTVSYCLVLFLLHIKPILNLIIKYNAGFRNRIEATRSFVLFKR